MGLVGAVARDLAPLQYEITHSRYPGLLGRVLGIFDAARAGSIPIEVRIEAAEALGQAGDPRLGLDNPERWVAIPAGAFLMGAQKRDRAKPNYDGEAARRRVPGPRGGAGRVQDRPVPGDRERVSRSSSTTAATRSSGGGRAGGFGQFETARGLG